MDGYDKLLHLFAHRHNSRSSSHMYRPTASEPRITRDLSGKYEHEVLVSRIVVLNRQHTKAGAS